mmetsp:Transcript_14641/g.27492  ORF Transcript_14641/g.27492 Transcript_14641/m.27492 type:complete len:497 (-) Transcript_14641:136-1626(-)
MHQASQGPASGENEAPAKEEYDPTDPHDLVKFLVDVDIRLVRASFLRQLPQGSGFPRRQEAEHLQTNESKKALVDAADLWVWADMQRSQNKPGETIYAVSHCWENTKHPDPFRHQLRALVDAAFVADRDWIFIDYISIYQRKRSEEQERNFQKALQNMHVLFMHDFTTTLCIQGFASREERDGCNERTVLIYQEDVDAIVQCPATGAFFEPPTIPFEHRGWCQAEVQWSHMRSWPKLVRLDGAGKSWPVQVPMHPDTFKQRLAEELHFSQDGDAELVAQLQGKAFREKAARCEFLHLDSMKADQLPLLTAALPHLEQLVRLSLGSVGLGEVDAIRLSSVLKAKNSVRILFLDGNQLQDTGAAALADALKVNSVLQILSLRKNGIRDDGAAAIADSLKLNKSLREICFNTNEIHDAGAVAFSQTLAANASLEILGLSNNPVGDAGALALANALTSNTSLKELDLRWNPQITISAACKLGPRARLDEAQSVSCCCGMM